MTATPKPGTVANITISTDARNVEPMTYEGAFYSGHHNAWISRTSGQIHTGPNDIWTVTDVRPLVVLDVEDGDARMLPRLLRRLADREQSESDKPGRLLGTTDALRKVAEQIEAQTKPQRIPEPGLWGVVTATTSLGGSRQTWTRDAGHDSAQWVALGDTMRREWDDLVDPIEIRAGIEGGAA